MAIAVLFPILKKLLFHIKNWLTSKNLIEHVFFMFLIDVATNKHKLKNHTRENI